MSSALFTWVQTRTAGHRRPPADPWLMGAVGTLLLFGTVMVYSASINLAARETGHDAYFLFRHTLHVCVGLGVMWLTSRSRLTFWERSGPAFLIVAVILLAAVIIPGLGTHINGSTRWFRFGGVALQPSELAKGFMVIYVAGYLVRRQEQLRQFTQGILMIGIVLAVVGMLLLQEPDLGTMVVIVSTVLAMLFLGGVRLWHFMVCIAAGIASVGILTLISPYRLERVTGFLNPWADPFNTGFQLVQALIAFGRGEWFGVGLGASVQKLFYLPAAHTDFLLAVIAEELGFVGVLGVMALFTILVFRAFAIARAAENVGLEYGARLAQGCGLLLGLQAMINMGVNLGVLPTKGLTLPLMSYGGSSMVSSCFVVGLLLAVDRTVRAQGGVR
ncbi:MAG: putative lipid II flippase FtsW [Acidiferrobacteraceae bacterium]